MNTSRSSLSFLQLRTVEDCVYNIISSSTQRKLQHDFPQFQSRSLLKSRSIKMRTNRYIEFCSAALLAAFIAITVPAHGRYLIRNGKNQKLSGKIGGDITSSTSDNVTSVSILEKQCQTSLKFYREGTELSDLVEQKTHRVKVNVSYVIDFAIVGNPKTGTTFMMDWMHRHPELLIPDIEMRAILFEGKGPGLSVEKLFPLYKQKTLPKQLGYKCPAVVRELPALRNMRDYFPKTKFIVGRYRESRLIILIVAGLRIMLKVLCNNVSLFSHPGIRHPVWWFQVS